jgi:hypothetical protein
VSKGTKKSTSTAAVIQATPEVLPKPIENLTIPTDAASPSINNGVTTGTSNDIEKLVASSEVVVQPIAPKKVGPVQHLKQNLVAPEVKSGTTVDKTHDLKEGNKKIIVIPHEPTKSVGLSLFDLPKEPENQMCYVVAVRDPNTPKYNSDAISGNTAVSCKYNIV